MEVNYVIVWDLVLSKIIFYIMDEECLDLVVCLIVFLVKIFYLFVIVYFYYVFLLDILGFDNIGFLVYWVNWVK